MDIWSVLGIEPTTDEEQIRNAYFTRLPFHHPEEDPDGFKELRSALEEALHQQETPEPMDNPEVRALTKKLNELYNDFGNRISAEAWQEFLKEPICQDLEREEEAGFAVLAFIMDHFRIPHDVFVILNEHFDWKGREEELYERFPDDFIKFIINHIDYQDQIRYALFNPEDGVDYDEFLSAYFSFISAVRENEDDKAREMMEKLLASGIRHPDLLIQQIRFLIYIEKNEGEAWKLSCRMLEEYGNDSLQNLYWYARSGVNCGHLSEVADAVARLLRDDSENINILKLCGDFEYQKENYETCRSHYIKAKKLCEDDWESLDEGIVNVMTALAVEYEGRLAEEPVDEWRWKLAEACFSSRQYKRTREILETIEDTSVHSYDYLRWMADCCEELEEFEAAVPWCEKLMEYQKETDDPVRLYYNLGRIYEKISALDKAVEIYSQGIEKFPESRILYYQKANALFLMDDDNGAMIWCDKGLDVGFYDPAFRLKIRLLSRADEDDKLIDLAEHVFRQGYENGLVRYYYACSLRIKERYQEAKENLDKALEMMGAHPVLHHEYALLLRDMEQSEEALTYINRSIEEEDSEQKEYLKGNILMDLERYEEEIEVYQKLVDQGSAYFFTYYRIACAMEKLRRFDEAVTFYQKAIEMNAEYGFAYCGLADTYHKMGRWDEAVENYKRGLSTEKHGAWGLWNLCRCLRRLNRDEESLEYARKGMEEYPDDKRFVRITAQLYSRMYREQEAIPYFEKYGQMDAAQYSYGLRMVAGCYADMEQFEKAEELYQKAIDEDTEEPLCWQSFGKYYWEERKDPEKALPYVVKALELKDSNRYTHLLAGEIYEALNQEEMARVCYEKSLELSLKDIEENPVDTCSYEAASDAYLHLKDYDKTMEMVREAHKLECEEITCSACGCYEGYEHESEVYEALGDLETALEFARKAYELRRCKEYKEMIARLEAQLQDNSEKP